MCCFFFLFFCLSRNAQASPRTRHAQLLLLVSWRSGAAHITAGMVSHRQIKAKACTTDSCKKGPETMQRFYILWTVTLYRLCVLNREVLAWNSSFLWEVRLRWFVLRCCGHSHTTRLCAQHMSNTSPHSCPCIAIWLLNHYQSFLEALLSLSFFLRLTSSAFL